MERQRISGARRAGEANPHLPRGERRLLEELLGSCLPIWDERCRWITARQ